MRSSLALVSTGFVASVVVVSCSAASTRATSSGAFGGSTASSSSAPSESSTSGITLEGGPDSCAGATTCLKEGVNCGPIGDGCGGVLQCGDCSSGQTCGGGGKPGVCGAVACIPKTCADLGANCGPVGDGCGNEISCGSCTNGDTCGGGGTPSVCGTGGTCTPATCAGLAVNCGPVADGCGNLLQCGSCSGSDTCGGGGISSVCGVPPCTPRTCASLGFDCGPTGDGCGGVLQCGTCTTPKTCGGSGTASVCGVPASCTGLCLDQVTCSSPGVTTTITGTVFAPNGVDPLPNALVYVPNAPVQPFTAGVSCDNCGAPASGSPLVSAVTAVDGTFTISNAPATSNVPLVIQLGRWRRQVTVPTVAACVANAVDASLTNMPNCSTTNPSCPAGLATGDIPLMAFSTGAVDALECVMLKIGIDPSEFTAPGGGGRINLYEGLDDTTVADGAAGGAVCSGSPTEDELWSTQAALNQYDVVLFPCQSNQTTRDATVQQNLINYANAGGRVFATHFSYVWLYNDAPFSSTAQWDVEQHPSPANQTGYVDTTFPKGLLLAQWLQIVGASSTLGQIPLQVLRHDNDGIVAPAQSWMTIQDPVFPGANVHYTFNTPVNAPASQQCGRVLFDDFHVENVSDSEGMVFPTECAGGPMTAQEKLLEFMIFDLSSCVTPDTPPTCTPQTCAQAGVACGPAGDGCGNLLQCGSCPKGQSCGGGGTPSVCGAPTCTPQTCQDQGIQCGNAGDGCGNAIVCGACSAGQTCGGGGSPGVCGTQKCTPQTCAEAGVACGPAGDGCGGLLQCGSCTAPETCGGGGMAGVCGTSTCTPQTCAQLGFNCGPAGDGCGNMLSCGTCSAPQTCGGGGSPGVCGGSGPTT